MKIKLELLEIVALQDVRAGRKPKCNTADLERFGLIYNSKITPAGTEVLKEHEPFGTTRDYSLEAGQSRKIARELKAKSQQI